MHTKVLKELFFFPEQTRNSIVLKTSYLFFSKCHLFFILLDILPRRLSIFCLLSSTVFLPSVFCPSSPGGLISSRAGFSLFSSRSMSSLLLKYFREGVKNLLFTDMSVKRWTVNSSP